MRVKMFQIDRQGSLEQFEEQVNALIKECEQQWVVVDADVLLDQHDPSGKSYLIVKYDEKESG